MNTTYFGETLEGTGQAEDRGLNKEKCEKHFVDQSKLVWGPQQREFREEIHQAKQVGVAEAVP
ncbi:hypothetical protein D0415_05295 [Staphylococcus lugdunensis]|uniref:Uncharacterized protein n=1 Tax=Staphylococcus lugdunensis TaxID=28035 RepID=A0A4V2KVX3_STALU|nr:hypothetical protein [Staphylococcus lugdunensis]QHP97393.1 hypothetical protein E5Z44_06660 [Staphylococcus lugdunensis]TBW73172.1 hypothetical protein EQ812_04190 [Staphylococcus lugdunensis]